MTIPMLALAFSIFTAVLALGFYQVRVNTQHEQRIGVLEKEMLVSQKNLERQMLNLDAKLDALLLVVTAHVGEKEK